MAEMESAESAAAALAAALGARAMAEQERRAAHDTMRATLTDLQLRDARLASDQESIERDRRRLVEERATAEAEVAAGRRAMAVPVPARDLDLEAALTEAERELADALAELAGLRAAHRAQGDELAAVRRAAAARQAELETARRRVGEVERRANEETERATAAVAIQVEREAGLAVVGARRTAALEAEAAATTAREAARLEAETAEAARTTAEARVAAGEAALASATARREALDERLAEEEERGIAKAARRAGGRRVDEDLVVDPGLRAAVETALAELARGYLVRASAVPGIAGHRGALVVEERTGAVSSTGPAAKADSRDRTFRDALAEVGGGLLADAIRHDGTGAATRLLARVAWVPDLAAGLAIQPTLPPGWVAIPRDGSAVVAELAVSLGAGDSVLERRAEAARFAAETSRLEGEVAAMRTQADDAGTVAASARIALEGARAEEARAIASRRDAEAEERVAARDLEGLVREAAWATAQAERVRQEHDRAVAALAALETSVGSDDGHASPSPAAEDQGAVETWESRANELRARRDRLAEEAATRETARRDAEGRRSRAEAAVGIGEERIGRADRELSGLEERTRALATSRDTLETELAQAVAAEAAARGALAESNAADSVERDRLAAAERAAAATRERLRATDERLRIADRDDLEARLGLEALRESVLVELAGLGELGVERLAAVAGGTLPSRPMAASEGSGVADPTDEALEVALESELETVLDRAATVWSTAAPTEPAPSAIRLGQLRRRFHELGATNPYAVEEYAELRQRLETLESQGSDLRTAIVRTRELIAELETMISDQFQTTFRALEAAFAARFEQLFGGGFARLSLTDPTDLGATGVEIVARPPGKKAQALAMLSGGERALTAVALLFAMLEVRPVPFCVLDEVDAALDEANIGRFADALRSLAHQTQFIVITHNRGTIEAADALYGVTVGDDSVSRVISLRLDEAQALAGRRGSELATAR